MENEELTVLFTKLINHQCNEQELRLVEQLLEVEANRLVFDRIFEERLQEDLEAEEVNSHIQPILDQKLDDILASIDESRNELNKKKILRIMATAAMLVMIVGGGFLCYKFRWTTSIQKTDLTTEVIRPGFNKAVLTLASGQKITLGEVGAGQIAQQSSISVEKTVDGQLIYHQRADEPLVRGEEISLNTLSVPIGGQYQIVLSDGTKVWLNAGSSITFPAVFTQRERVVQLKGEAYFEVSKLINSVTRNRVPFIVKSNYQQVEVLGTAFNVNAYDDEKSIRTTLLHGAVRVCLDPSAPKGAKILPKILRPGEQAELSPGNLIVSEGNTEAATAWKNGLFQFENENIYSVMRKISRWYNVEVEYSGAMESKVFTGTITKYENVDKVLKMLSLTGTVSFDLQGRKIRVF